MKRKLKINNSMNWLFRRISLFYIYVILCFYFKTFNYIFIINKSAMQLYVQNGDLLLLKRDSITINNVILLKPNNANKRIITRVIKIFDNHILTKRDNKISNDSDLYDSYYIKIERKVYIVIGRLSLNNLYKYLRQIVTFYVCNN